VNAPIGCHRPRRPLTPNTRKGGRAGGVITALLRKSQPPPVASGREVRRIKVHGVWRWQRVAWGAGSQLRQSGCGEAGQGGVTKTPGGQACKRKGRRPRHWRFCVTPCSTRRGARRGHPQHGPECQRLAVFGAHENLSH
jgi:hypothetical protein